VKLSKEDTVAGLKLIVAVVGATAEVVTLRTFAKL
jgi:hypothetical protein